MKVELLILAIKVSLICFREVTWTWWMGQMLLLGKFFLERAERAETKAKAADYELKKKMERYEAKR